MIDSDFRCSSEHMEGQEESGTRWEMYFGEQYTELCITLAAEILD